MKKSKNILPSIAMIASLVVLTGFTVFWVYKSYQEQKNILQKDLSNVFEKTVVAMQDSLIKSQLPSDQEIKKIDFLREIKQPSLPKAEIRPQIKRVLDEKYTFISSQSTDDKADSSVGDMRMKITVNPKNSNISPDSLRAIVAKLTASAGRMNNSPSVIILKIQQDSIFSVKQDSFRQVSLNNSMVNLIDLRKKNPTTKIEKQFQTFKKEVIQKPESSSPHIVFKINDTQKSEVKTPDLVFEIKNDSLDLKQLNEKYRKQLAKNALPAVFSIQKSQTKPQQKQFAQLQTQPQVAGNPFRFYWAESTDFKPFLLKKIVPEILFSLFLVGLTALAFGLINRNLQRQQRLTELKNDFIGNITHELKTPIATVSVAIEALSNFNVLQNPEKTKEYLEISKNELGRLSMLVDKVLKMSVFEEKGLTLEKQEVDFKQLLNTVLVSMKLQFETHKAQVQLHVTEADYTLEGDAVHLTNVIYNLFDNALKYSSKPIIEVFLSPKQNQLVFAVKDNGQGIAEEYQDRIFEKFFRVPTGNVHNTKGHGLGLSYVQNVVQQHGGSITVESKVGQGSEFMLTLPTS